MFRVSAAQLHNNDDNNNNRVSVNGDHMSELNREGGREGGRERESNHIDQPDRRADISNYHCFGVSTKGVLHFFFVANMI